MEHFAVDIWADVFSYTRKIVSLQDGEPWRPGYDLSLPASAVSIRRHIRRPLSLLSMSFRGVRN
jgi:hypothetical protein